MAHRLKLLLGVPSSLLESQCESWLLCFHPSFLLLCVGKQQAMAQEHGSLPQTGAARMSAWLLEPLASFNLDCWHMDEWAGLLAT